MPGTKPPHPPLDPIQANRDLWNRWTDLHVGSEFYDVAGFKAGKDRLDAIVLGALGDVAGKSLLHVQCRRSRHALPRPPRRDRHRCRVLPEGDRSYPAARGGGGTRRALVLSEAERLPENLTGELDVVFSSWGFLPRLGDLDRWAEVIAHFLRPGGVFAMVEAHPRLLDLRRRARRPRPAVRAAVPLPWFGLVPGNGSYAEPRAAEIVHETCQWYRPLCDILPAPLDAGLVLERFEEHPESEFPTTPQCVQGDDGCWRLPPEVQPQPPLSFSLRARR